MSHSLTCALRIPLIALIIIISFWLSIQISLSQGESTLQVKSVQTSLAKPQSAVASNEPLLKVRSQWNAHPLKRQDQRVLAQDRTQLNQLQGGNRHNPSLQLADNLSTTEQLSVTLYPASTELVHRLFDLPTQNQRTPFASAIMITKTVGLATDCAVTQTLVIAAPTEVVYCYVIVNTGDVTLTKHSFVDDKIGIFGTDYEYRLPPFKDNVLGAAFFTQPALVEESIHNLFQWTATDDNGENEASDMDDAWVVIPTVALTTTLSIDPSTCGQDQILSTFPQTEVTICYTIKNTNPITLFTHTVKDSSKGLLLDNLFVPLGPEEEYIIKRSMIATETTSSIITWTATTNNGVTAQAIDTIRVQVPSMSLQATVGAGTTECPTTDTITVTIDTMITICYLTTNTGGDLLEYHTISDTLYGVYSGFHAPLAPDSSLGVTITVPATQTSIVTAMWSAAGANNLLAQASDTFTVIIPANTAVEVYVFYDVDAQGLRNDLEPGLSGIEVSLLSSSNRIYTATSDSTGLARLEGLPESGNFTTTITTKTLPSGYFATTNLRRIQVEGGEVATRYYGFASPPGTDADADNIPDRTEGSYDVDKDRRPNYNDEDADGDGIPDRIEGTGDLDRDGIPNYLDPDITLFLPMVNR